MRNEAISFYFFKVPKPSTPMVLLNGKISYRQQTNNLDIFLTKDAILLDVRTIQEFARTKIPNSRHVALEELPNLIAQIKSWNAPIITYCNYGDKSRIATEILERFNIKVMDGGAKNDLIKLLQKKEFALTDNRKN